MSSFVEIDCVVCGKKVQRRRAEVDRSKRMDRRHYCSRSCCGKDNINNLPDGMNGSPQYLLKGGKGRPTDPLSPFRYHMKSVIQHAKKKGQEVTISLQDMSRQWERQEGRCPYTGWEMFNTPSSNRQGIQRRPDQASLDRRDSSKGYTPDNIQFISLMANYAKNDFAETELLRFCEAVHENRL